MTLPHDGIHSSDLMLNCMLRHASRQPTTLLIAELRKKSTHPLWLLSPARQVMEGDAWACLADLVGNCTLQTAQETAQAILKVNTLLHAELPSAHLLSLAVLPKGEMWPNCCTDAILAVNAELQVRQRAPPAS